MTVALLSTKAVLRSRRRKGSRWESGSIPQEDGSQFENDREVILRVHRLIREGDLDWLGSETFTTSWRDDQVVFLRELPLVDAGRSNMFDPALRAAVGRLTVAAETFIRAYDGSTIDDPIMRDATWRTIGRPRPAGETDVLAEGDRIVTQNLLREAAAEICTSYSELSAASRARFPTD